MRTFKSKQIKTCIRFETVIQFTPIVNGGRSERDALSVDDFN